MHYLCAVLLFIIPVSSHADVKWSDFSVSLLRGTNYQVGDANRTVFTLEHAAGYSWGDSFLFIDRLESDNGEKETYIELSPRWQLSAYQNNWLEHLYLSTTVEVGENFTNYLVGVGTNLKIPHFIFVKANLYHKDVDLGDNAIQSTISWALPIGPLTYDGFIDYVSSTDDSHTSMNLTSQLKYNIGTLIDNKTNLYLGVEYVYWQNKYGIKGVDEKNLNLLVKYHF